ncbi:MAG: fatty acid desaturase [Bdellovibrionota bacterium]
MKDFKNDRHYLLRYGIIWTVVCLGASALLLNLRGLDTSFSLTIYDLFYLLAVIPLLGPLAAIFHNSTHGSVGSRKTNLIIGEILGLIFLYGHRNFKLGHLLHHRYTDDPDLDPDYRRHETLMGFVLHQGEQIYHAVKTFYLKTHGTNEETLFQIKIQGRVLGLSIVARLAFWFVLLGMKPFLLFFLPVVIGNIIFFSHINFVSHAIGGSGIPVQNQKTVGIMTYLNFMTFGGYQHHNHHARPGVFHHGRVTT